MARIKKQGLDYFPMDTDFVRHRVVRRIMKQEGEGALSVLLLTLSHIYGGEGYYAVADDLFYDDISVDLYAYSEEDARRIIGLAVRLGLFDEGLFRSQGILTSAEIQRQYLFSTKRRKTSAIRDAYLLLQEEDMQEADKQKVNKKRKTDNVTFKAENATSAPHSIAQQSIAKNSIAEQSTVSPLPSSPRGSGEEKEEEGKGEENGCGNPPQATPNSPKAWTQEEIDRLAPPADGTERNYAGLLENLRAYRIPPAEQYVIIRKSDFGAIGHPVWKGLYELRKGAGKVKLPGRFLMSVVGRRG